MGDASRSHSALSLVSTAPHVGALPSGQELGARQQGPGTAPRFPFVAPGSPSGGGWRQTPTLEPGPHAVNHCSPDGVAPAWGVGQAWASGWAPGLTLKVAVGAGGPGTWAASELVFRRRGTGEREGDPGPQPVSFGVRRRLLTGPWGLQPAPTPSRPLGQTGARTSRLCTECESASLQSHQGPGALCG